MGDLLALSFAEVEEKPDQPEALAILRRMKKLGLSYADGGYENQPYLLMLELDAAIDAENEYWQRVIANRAAQERAANADSSSGDSNAPIRKL